MDDRAAMWIGRAKGLITPAMRDAIGALDVRNRLIAEYHLGFVDASGRPTNGDGGKMIRGALALLSGRVAGGSPHDAVPAAVAIELVHHYSLLHDDIIDEDRIRRHRPAAWVVFGVPAAILAGDAVAARATAVLLESDQPGAHRAAVILADATGAMLAGQAADIAFEQTDSADLDDVRAMVADKTGALLAAAAATGAALLGADDAMIEALHRFGHHIGMAFQLVDDVLGIWGDAAVTGKPVTADLAARKKSLPVAAALDRGGEAADLIRRHYTATTDLKPETLAGIAAAMDATGARDWALGEAGRETDAALAIIDSLPVADDVIDDLTAFTRMLCRRDA